MLDQVIDFVWRWSEKTEIQTGGFIAWLGIAPSKFYSWCRHNGCVNEHNGWVPRDSSLVLWESRLSSPFYQRHPLEGYRH